MSVSREELAAFADGELGEPRRAQVAAEIAADPVLAEQVRAHAALKAQLSAHFAPILDAPLPERLTAPLGGGEAGVADFAAGRQRREARRTLPRWSWIAGPALAASLALAVILPRGGETPEGYAGAQLAAALDGQLVASQPGDAGTRILLSFRNGAGAYCRAFSGNTQSGIACRDTAGWRLDAAGASAAPQQGDYRMAGSSAAAIMARAQDMAAGPALTAEEEAAAKANGWR